ncbi:sigma-54-dependent Fis family transcriptional regulator [Mangrovibacter phragmitis]|uniref:sigma-54-dependent Fis family transcriptional regulator n=1 Tax=Mangrovibacter phragmitis TaxID=1691903 RepID=UPI003512F781
MRNLPHDTPLLSPASILSDSWRRSQHYGLARDDDHRPVAGHEQLGESRHRYDWIARYASPLLAQLTPQFRTRAGVLVLSDPGGMVLESTGNSGFLQKAEQLALAPGNVWSEDARGTNAIGTALALGRYCEVSGKEHFLSRHAALFCAAMPVYSPRGELAGVIDISSPASLPWQDATQLLSRAAWQIEQHWVQKQITAGQVLVQLRPQGQPELAPFTHSLIFEDGILQGANSLACRDFGLQPQDFGQRHQDSIFACAMENGALAWMRDTAYQMHIDRAQKRPGVTVPDQRPGKPAEEPTALLAPTGVNLEKTLRVVNAGIALCINGETGCGKEYLGQHLYRQSKWRSGNFVAINCAALPEHLIESELFGYMPGAFTGASSRGYAGKFREANGGMLFLDEIGDMPLALQTRLLRVLQEKRVVPLGGNSAFPVDFSLVCATHRNLVEQVERGLFREDLLYRIQEFTVEIPPLRQWQNKGLFIEQLWSELGAPVRGIRLCQSVVSYLADCPWPGNVRQLLSQLKVLLALSDNGQTVTLCDLPDLPRSAHAPLSVPPTTRTPNETACHAPCINELEAIRISQGNMSEAAKRLGISRSTLYRRLEKQRA